MHSKEMMCEVDSLQYDFKTHTGTLYMADGNCTDMKGCINFFKRIDPDVELIETVAGSKPDTVYKLVGSDWSGYMRG